MTEKGGPPPPLARLHGLIEQAVWTQTAALWPDIERAYPWVHKAAHILNNHDGEDAATVQRRFDGLVGAMVRHRDSAGSLRECGRALRQGHPQLPPGPVSLLPRSGPAAHQQRSGARVRLATLPRAASERTQDSLACGRCCAARRA